MEIPGNSESANRVPILKAASRMTQVTTDISPG